jgi:hypothetical protein
MQLVPEEQKREPPASLFSLTRGTAPRMMSGSGGMRYDTCSNWLLYNSA